MVRYHSGDLPHCAERLNDSTWTKLGVITVNLLRLHNKLEIRDDITSYKFHIRSARIKLHILWNLSLHIT